ncbi:MAG: bifunctional metallophosphatase/5'-nucleotidase [Aminivibrio sp.]|jgi:5'-nucleotidase/UDP-sugar diphosphatase
MKLLRNRIFAVIALLILLPAAAFAGSGVTLLSMNDIHGRIYPEDGAGGLAKASTIVSRARAEAPGDVFLFEIGDVNEGPLFFYFRGHAEMRGLSLMGVEAGTLGNHEFDLGEEVLFEAARRANFPIVVSNLRYRDGRPAPFPQWGSAASAGGLKIGYFGLVPPALASVTSGSGGFAAGQDLGGEAERMVSLLKREGCDIIVLLSHCGLEDDRLIARSVAGIHAILGGHSHTLMEEGEFVEGPGGWVTAIGQAGSYARHVGRMDLALQNGRVDAENTSWRVIPLGADVPEDKRVAWLIEPFRERLAEKLSVPLAPRPVDMDGRAETLRRKEAPLGSFIADAFRWKAGTDVAFVGGGSIRGDKVYKAGDVSYADITNMMPFGGSLWKGALSGEDLLAVLETSASGLIAEGDDYDGAMRVPTGGFLQVSGLRVVFDSRKQPLLIDSNSVVRKAGERLVRAEIQREDGSWAPLDPKKTYTVAVTDWTGGGGDKHYIFKKNASVFASMEQMYLEATAEYIRFRGEMAADVEGRITIIE